MRMTMLKALAAATVAAALLLPASQAQALTPAASSGIAAAADQIGSIEKTRLVQVCRTFWNGYRWVKRCRWVTVYSGPYQGPCGPYYYRGRYYRGRC